MISDNKENKIEKNLLEQYMKEYSNSEDNSLSFFDIVNRSHDENMISLMLKYLFMNDSECLKNILNKAYNKNFEYMEVEDVITEYSILKNKRIDLLIKATINNKKSIIVIENKVYSYEHDNQCEVYYKYIKNAFLNEDKYYLFLKPKYNSNTPGCKEFKIITYNDILDLITRDDDVHINDFKNEIRNNLVVEEMTNLDNFMLDNYKEIYDKVNDWNKKINKFLYDDFGEEIQKYLKCERKEFYSGDYSIRFYDANCWSEWKDNKNDVYYFYVELVSMGKNIKEPYFQRIIKRYTIDDDSNISKYLNNKYPMKKASDLYYVIDRVSFVSDKNIMSQEWKEELIEKGKEILKQMYDKQCIDVSEFLENIK